ncbi:MAG: CARDB domain-containing protein [Euryarchaeota archaeon]
MTGKTRDGGGNFASALLPVLMFILASMTPMLVANPQNQVFGEPTTTNLTGSANAWTGLEQPWGQFGRTPTHNGSMPAHGPEGGPGEGLVSDVLTLGTITEPGVNWVALDDGVGTDTYGSIIADFSSSITAPDAAQERCADEDLFAVLVHSDATDTYLTLVAGDDAKIAWQVNIGETKDVRSTPSIADINNDGRQEIILVYDTQSAVNIELWSPELSCTESGWDKSGHENEKLWSYTDVDYRIGIESPHTPSSQSNHLSVTQPLLADLSLDGSPELVLSVVDETSNDPTVLAFSLTTSVPSEPDWAVALDRGTHPSSPAWAALDSTNTAVVLTTIDANGGSMWVWRIDGATGSLDWERVAVQGTDSDTDAPRLRLPGPVIAQLDDDDAPEMILTVPTDANGRTSGLGARFIGMELTSTDQIFNFRAPNGYADAEPLVVDTTGDGLHDRLCWVTWFSESQFSFNRQGLTGCHDISDDTPFKEWSRDLQRGNGNDNDEIAVASPIWLDIDGSGAPELVVPFGMRLWAFDGETGASADINNAWSSPLAMPHRVWASPAAADMDGDGRIDILIGDTLVSQLAADLAPLADNRGISFNPATPDPGDQVTVTGQFSNIGTLDNQENVDVVLRMNGEEIARERFAEVEPVSPSGEGGPLTFSATFVAELGEHEFTLVLDVNNNLTEARKDNNNASMVLNIVDPFVSRIDPPFDPIRIAPGTTDTIALDLIAIGSKTAEWTLTYDDEAFPEGWSFSPNGGSDLTPTLIPNSPVTVSFGIAIPSTALGDENSYVDLILTLDEDETVVTTLRLPIEVLRTRGLSVVGPSGLGESTGFGRPNHDASAWLVVENLGNAQESTTSIDWTAPSWGGTPALFTAEGTEVFSLTLGPNEDVELFATLPVPSNAQLSSTSNSMLTLCIGSGESTLCQELDITFQASEIEATPSHIRTLPNTTLSWSVQTNLPSDGSLEWNMASALMVHTGWVWSSTGDLTVNGTSLEITGTPNAPASGTLELSLPVNAVPQRHVFSQNEATKPHYELNISLHVLQVFRSAATVLDPLPPAQSTVVSFNVSETEPILLRLENPGNGEDTFVLTGEALAGPTMSQPPTVEFTIYNPERTLGPLATTIATVDVLLSDDIPALSPFELVFTWTSQGDSSVASSASLMVQAEPDHQWNISNITVASNAVIPGEEVTVNFNMTNIGNTPDTLNVNPSFTITHAGNDTSVWASSGAVSEQIAVNGSEAMSVSFTVPTNAWYLTSAVLNIDLFSGDIFVKTTAMNFTVSHDSGWRFNLSNTSLTIAPGGENLTLKVDQIGNHPEAPWYTKAGQGWAISLPNNGDVVNPGQSTTVTVFVTPPEGALAGEVGVLRIRISDANGAGQIVQEIPVRVGEEANISIEHRGTWKVNADGGMPTAWVANYGNDVAVMQVSVTGLPAGWTLNGSSQVVVAPGQMIGLPLMLTPESNWNEQRFIVGIELIHPTLGILTHDLEVETGAYTFHSTPVQSGRSGTVVTIELGQAVDGGLTTTDNLQFFEQSVELTIGSVANELLLQSSSDESDRMSIYINGYDLPIVDVRCDLTAQAFVDLGRVELEGRIGDCEVVASMDEELRATIMLITDRGETITLKMDSIVLAPGANATYELNVTGWKPSAGVRTVTVVMVDSYGRILEERSIETTARASGWNIGIFSFSANEDLKVSVQRISWNRLAGVNCHVTVVSLDSGWTTTRVIDVAEGDFPPVVTIPSPDGMKDDEELKATLRCDAPYDVDDDSGDDEAIAFYKAPDQPLVERSELVISVAVAALLLVVAYLAGVTKPPKSGSSQGSKGNQKSKDDTKPLEHIEPIEETVVEEVDEFSFELPTDLDEPQTGVPDTTQAHVESIEVIELPDEEDASPSGRLASMRDEITTDGPSPEGRQDRMRDFFGKE